MFSHAWRLLQWLTKWGQHCHGGNANGVFPSNWLCLVLDTINIDRETLRSSKPGFPSPRKWVKGIELTWYLLGKHATENMHKKTWNDLTSLKTMSSYTLLVLSTASVSVSLQNKSGLFKIIHSYQWEQPFPPRERKEEAAIYTAQNTYSTVHIHTFQRDVLHPACMQDQNPQTVHCCVWAFPVQSKAKSKRKWIHFLGLSMTLIGQLSTQWRGRSIHGMDRLGLQSVNVIVGHFTVRDQGTEIMIDIELCQKGLLCLLLCR